MPSIRSRTGWVSARSCWGVGVIELLSTTSRLRLQRNICKHFFAKCWPDILCPVSQPLRVVLDDLSGPEVASLLADHLSSMRRVTPAESVHALDLTGLRTPEVTFWSAWVGGDLAGCGALKELDPRRGEVKSMRTAPAHLRRGVAAAVLAEIVAAARARGYGELLLETGHGPEFDAAHALYARAGFEPCGPFAGYTDDPFSRFFRLDLTRHSD
jgi:putative acetyltransferase